jgi:hypothetical protein
MSFEYSTYCSDLSKLVLEYSNHYAGIQFHEKEQAIEVFAMQALAMASSSLRAAALLLENDAVPEAILVTRSIQELFFSIRWILEPTEQTERLERVYQLEGGPYAHWQKEVDIIRKLGEEKKDENILARAERFYEPLTSVATTYTHLVVQSPDGTFKFKSPPAFANRMSKELRAMYHHMYCYTSLFAHPTPMVKEHYLNVTNGPLTRYTPDDDAVTQSLAYTFLFTDLLVGSAEEILASHSQTTAAAREDVYRKIIELVKKANKGTYASP